MRPPKMSDGSRARQLLEENSVRCYPGGYDAGADLQWLRR